MSNKDESRCSRLESINIDLHNKAVDVRAEGGTVLHFTYTPRGVLLQLTLGTDVNLSPASSPDDIAGLPIAETPAEPAAEARPSARPKSPAQVLSGKLQTRPAEGRPDGRGNPTAGARFLAHRAGDDGALLISATFHNRTTAIALGLDAGDAITAQGYYHPSRDPQRLPTFSVFHLMNYPGNRVSQLAGDQPVVPPQSS